MRDWLLLPDAGLFLGAAGLCLLEIVRSKEDVDAATSSAGTEMRRRIHLLLLVANMARCICLVAETLLFVEYSCPSSWTCALVRTVPDLFFLTTYGLLILFWAQLSHTATGAPFPRLRPAFLISNGLLYVGFLLIVIMGGSRVLSGRQVLQALFVLLGVSYILWTMFWFKYAFRFSKMALPYVVRRRLIALCVLCGLVFPVHVAYYLGVASGLLSTWVAAAGYPPQLNAYVFDALLYPLWELLPSIAILAVLHKRKSGSGMAPHHLSSAYPYLDSVPYTKIGSGQLGNGQGGTGGGAGNGYDGASRSAALASAFYKLNGSSDGRRGGGRGFGAGGKGGRPQQQQHPWMNVVVKEGKDAQGGKGVLGLMGIYTPIEATTTPSTSSESAASAYQGVS